LPAEYLVNEESWKADNRHVSVCGLVPGDVPANHPKLGGSPGDVAMALLIDFRNEGFFGAS
jgi:hypothetical protein